MSDVLKIKELLKMDIQNCSNKKSKPFGYVSSKNNRFHSCSQKLLTTIIIIKYSAIETCTVSIFIRSGKIMLTHSD